LRCEPRPGRADPLSHQLERQLAKAQTSGDQKAQHQAHEAIVARKSWLAEAEHTLADHLSPGRVARWGLLRGFGSGIRGLASAWPEAR
jgi:hypothetical protein